jgi:hypothetical protein
MGEISSIKRKTFHIVEPHNASGHKKPGTRPGFGKNRTEKKAYPFRASAPPTISRISLVMAAWRALL